MLAEGKDQEAWNMVDKLLQEKQIAIQMFVKDEDLEGLQQKGAELC